MSCFFHPGKWFGMLMTIGVLLLAGCTLVDQLLDTRPTPLSGFLPKQELLVSQPEESPFYCFYVNTEADGYENIYIAPVQMLWLRTAENWNSLDQTLKRTLAADTEILAGEIRKAYIEEFTRREKMSIGMTLHVVSDFQTPRTLILQCAVTAIVPTVVEQNGIGGTCGLVSPGTGVSAEDFAPGTLVVECKVVDAVTNEVIAMYAAAESDQKELFNLAGFPWYASARINARALAEKSAELLSEKNYRTFPETFPEIRLKMP